MRSTCSCDVSSVKCISGQRGSCSPSINSLRINPAACSSALIASLCSLFDPFTLTNTRACFISGCTRTWLTTTLPSSRGSFSSPASMALISCAISSPTRSCRWFVALILVHGGRSARESLRRAAAQTISNLSPIKNDPKISSALSNTFCNISRTCFSSFDNVTTPITDRCQTSWCSNSATATLNSLRSLSFKLRSTCLLSLSDCASGMCSSRVSKPTGMSGPYFIVTRDRDLPTPSGGELLAPGRRSALSRGFGGRKLGHLEAFQNVADLDVVEVRDADAALEPGTNFARVVFETLQRTQLRRVDYRFIAQHAHLRIALEDAVDHVATGDRSQAFDAERVANFRAAQIRLLHDRLEQ